MRFENLTERAKAKVIQKMREERAWEKCGDVLSSLFEINPFPCLHCHRSFKEQRSLIIHIGRIHKEEAKPEPLKLMDTRVLEDIDRANVWVLGKCSNQGCSQYGVVRLYWGGFCNYCHSDVKKGP